MTQLSNLPNFELISKGKCTSFLDENQLSTFHELIEFVAKIPYGRNSKSGDFYLIFLENKATCSTKHGFLMEICELNNILEVELMVGIFLMSGDYSSKIKPVLDLHNLEALPEAHCYLRFNNQRFDFTTQNSEVKSFESFLIREQRCDSHQVFDWKPMIHKNFLESWLKRKNLGFTVDELWEIRETCILKLSE
ncbi:MAG: hypothetical protein V4622_13300 [Bacteroidota bacterium]